MIAGVLEIQIMAGLARISEDMRRAERIVGDSMAKVEKSARSARTAMESLTAGFGAMVALQQIKQMSDSYTKLDAQLRLSTKNQREYNQALADVQRISTTAQTNIGATSMLYTRMLNVTRGMNIEQSKIATVAETVSYGLKAYGATAAEASSASLQLSQAMGANRLGGEEFRAVMEAMPNVMKVLADSMGVPLGQLRQLSIDGKITTEVMLKAFSNPEIAAAMRRAAEQTRTIGGELVVMGNNAMQFVGALMKLSGAQGGAIGLIASMSDALKLAVTYVAQITSLLITLAVVYAGKFVAGLVQARMATMAMNAAQVEATAINLAMAQSARAGAQAGLIQASQVALMTGNTKLATAARIEYMSASAAVAAAEALHAQATLTWMGKLRAFAVANKTGLIGLALWGAYTIADHLGWLDQVFGSATKRVAAFKTEMETMKYDEMFFERQRLISLMAKEEASWFRNGENVGQYKQQIGMLTIAMSRLKKEQAVEVIVPVAEVDKSKAKAVAAVQGMSMMGKMAEDMAAKDMRDAVAITNVQRVQAAWKRANDNIEAARANKASKDQIADMLRKRGTEDELRMAKHHADASDADAVEKEVLALQKQTADEIAKYEADMSARKLKRDLDDIEDAKREYHRSVESYAQLFTQSVTKGLKNGEGAMVTFANALGTNVEKAMSEAMSKTITSTVTGDGKSSNTDWVMAIVGIVAMISTAARNTATAAEISKVTASEVQKLQGTGSILGDALAQSHSISNSLSMIQNSTLQTNKYSVTMVDHLQSIDRDMHMFVTAAGVALGGDIAATMGIARDEKYSSGLTRGYGDLQTPLQNAIRDAVWGTHTSTVTDTGIIISGAIKDLAAGLGVGTYAAGTNVNSGLLGTGIGGSSSTWTQYGAASAGLAESIAGVYAGISDTFKTMALNMGMDISNVNATVDNFVTTIGKLSLEGLNAEEKVKALETAMSKDSDLLAQQLFPALMKFNVAGEGMFETVVRVNLEIENADAFFKMLGRDINVAAENADALSNALGGIDAAAKKMRSFIATFAPVEVAVTNSQKALEALGFANLDSMTTTESWWALMQTANEDQLIAILNNQPAIEAYIAAIDTQKSATEAATSALKAETDAKIKAAQTAYSDAATAVSALKAAGVAVRDLIASIGASSATTGQLRQRFAITNALAASGDIAAQGKLSESANAYLASAKSNAESTQDMARATAFVQASLNTTALAIEGTVSAAEATLTAAQEANAFLASITSNTAATKNNITALAAALDALPPAIVGANGTVSDAMVLAMGDFNVAVTNAYAQLTTAMTNGYGAIAAAIAGSAPPPQVVAPVVSTPSAVEPAPVATPAVDTIASAYATAQAATAAAEKAAALTTMNNAAVALQAAKDAQTLFMSTGYVAMMDSGVYLYQVKAMNDAAGYATATTSAQTAYDTAQATYNSYAVGSNYIDRDQIAQIHAGEEITPRPYVDMQRVSRDETNTLLTRLVNSNAELRNELAQLRAESRAENNALVGTAQRTERILDKWDHTGMPEVTTV